MALEFLPNVLVKKGGKPPPESKADAANSGHMKKAKSTAVLVTDGNASWKAELKKHNAKAPVHNVSHWRMEFVR